MNISKYTIEEQGWHGIDRIMELLNENVIKFTEQTKVNPDDMRKYINAQVDTIINNAWWVRIGRNDVFL